MSQRLDYHKVSPQGVAPLRQLESYISDCGIEHSLLELVKTRASQINGCAYCLDMHSKTLRKNGESEQRLYLLNGWRESPLYTPRERAALAWTDALTRIAEAHPSDALYDEVRRHFDEKEVVDLTTLVGMINTWNRLAISLGYEHPAGAGS